MPTTELAQQTRDIILRDLSHGPKTAWDIVSKHFPKAERTSADPDYSRFTRLANALQAEGKIEKVDKHARIGPWKLREKPHVGDLPDAPREKRTYTKRDQNGTAANVAGVATLRAYLIRDIRTKLDELEKLG